MKILVLANSFAGLYKFRKEVLQELANENELLACSPDGEFAEEIKSLGCKIIDTPIDRRGTNIKKDFGLFRQYLQIVKQEKPDMILTYTIKPNIYGGLVARLKKIPYFSFVTGLGTSFQGNGILKKLVVFLNKISLKKAKYVFFENSENARIMQDLKIADAKQVCLMPGAGVNIIDFAYHPLDKANANKFCFVGRIMKEKGVEELFNAIEKLKEEGCSATFDFYGGYEEDYAEKIKKLEDKNWIKYHGIAKDMKEIYRDYACEILPSYHEGMSNALLEGASCGLALITTNIPGCKEAVEDGKNGYLCKVKDVDSLYDCIKKYFELPYEMKQSMGKNSRDLMEKVFDKKIVVRKTLECIWKGEKGCEK